MNSSVDNIIRSLLEKDLFVKSFFAPKFIKVKDSLILIKFLNGTLLNYEKGKYNLNNLFRSKEVTIFKKYSASFTSSKIKDKLSTLVEVINNEEANKSATYPSLTKNKLVDFSIINKNPKVITVLEKEVNQTKTNENTKLFHSYLEKLKKLTDHIENLNKVKLSNRDNIFNCNLEKNNFPHFNKYKYVRDNSNNVTQNDVNHTNAKFSKKILDVKNNSYNSWYSINNDLKNEINLETKIDYKKDILKKEELNSQNVDLDKYNKLTEIYSNLSNKQQQLYNDSLLKINNKIDDLANKLIPYFENIKGQLSSFGSEESVVLNTIKSNFNDLNCKISEIKNLCDLNGVDIDHLNDYLSPIDFKELINLLKEMNVNIHVLVNKQKKLQQNEIEVSNEIKALESKLKAYNQEHVNNLIKQISILQKNQSDHAVVQEKNNGVIIHEIRNILDTVNVKKDTTNELQERLNNILNKQENLFQEAVNIKNYILSNKNSTSTVNEKANTGLHVLIEEIKSNNNVVKEQNIFNEKIHKDMEIIKKSIIKLIDEQAKENNKNSNNYTDKALKEGSFQKNVNQQPPILNKNSSAVTNNMVSQYRTNTSFTQQENNKVKIQSKELYKVAQMKMAIGKLKEALDLDSIHTIKELHTEYIDEIIEDKIDKNNLNTIQNNNENNSKDPTLTQAQTINPEAKSKAKEHKNNGQSTFVLDNSKFFK